MSLNESAYRLARIVADNPQLGIEPHTIAGAEVLDFGVQSRGSLAAGLLLTRLCMGDQVQVALQADDTAGPALQPAVTVQTDRPLLACLGSQYAGWPVQADDYFAMGSGPFRLLRGREPVLESLGLAERSNVAVGVLESTELPTAGAVAEVANCVNRPAEHMTLCVAPAGSLAGSIQVVARSVETAMHKLHECGFDARQVRAGWGVAPLPPIARRNDVVGGIGRTNDAILYGGRVTLWVDVDQTEVERVIDQIPSQASRDYGRPFAEVFKSYDYDFYKVDPRLFSPAVVTIVNLRTGAARQSGRLNPDVLQQSFFDS